MVEMERERENILCFLEFFESHKYSGLSFWVHSLSLSLTVSADIARLLALLLLLLLCLSTVCLSVSNSSV